MAHATRSATTRRSPSSRSAPGTSSTRRVGGKTLTFGTPAWDAYFTKTLHTGIRLLMNQGAQVALMGIPCYRPIAAGGLPLLPERGDDSRTSHLNELLQSALCDGPPTRLHDPSAVRLL